MSLIKKIVDWLFVSSKPSDRHPLDGATRKYAEDVVFPPLVQLGPEPAPAPAPAPVAAPPQPEIPAAPAKKPRAPRAKPAATKAPAKKTVKKK